MNYRYSQVNQLKQLWAVPKGYSQRFYGYAGQVDTGKDHANDGSRTNINPLKSLPREIIAEAINSLTNMSCSLLCIAGAIQVLEELLGQGETTSGTGMEAATDGT